jgi:hypothetical protein
VFKLRDWNFRIYGFVAEFYGSFYVSASSSAAGGLPRYGRRMSVATAKSSKSTTFTATFTAAAKSAATSTAKSAAFTAAFAAAARIRDL